MDDALTAFPADGYTARWQTWDRADNEALTLRWENEGWTATGEVGREAITYVIRLTATWQVSQFLLFRDLDEPDLWLGTDGAGRWGEMNGAHRPDIDGCFDIDLTCTPFTNSLPIRRVRLNVGDSTDVIAATINVETLGVTPVRQRYRRLTPRRFEHQNLHTGLTTEFDIDEYGLLHDYPDNFRRA
ncbi:MAG: putative glycolipid-binding domain-containing protein [Ilumatobacteraceae bacterium]|nr:putative glycolipid-binding domain-containing protein [Ilumatobacteraceae bacterium]